MKKSEHKFLYIVTEFLFGVLWRELYSVGFLVFWVPEVADHGAPTFLFFYNIDELVLLGAYLKFFGYNFEGNVGFEVLEKFFGGEGKV